MGKNRKYFVLAVNAFIFGDCANKFQVPNSKSQINSKFQNSMPPVELVETWSLKFDY
jgi:hypothetical protein